MNVNNNNETSKCSVLLPAFEEHFLKLNLCYFFFLFLCALMNMTSSCSLFYDMRDFT